MDESCGVLLGRGQDWADGGVSGVARATPRWRAQSSTSAVASHSVWAAFSADLGATQVASFFDHSGEVTWQPLARATPGKVLGHGFFVPSMSHVRLAACDLSLCRPLSCPGCSWS